jgi:hypothetical protein
MIGEQKTGRIEGAVTSGAAITSEHDIPRILTPPIQTSCQPIGDGAVISNVVYESLKVEVKGNPARLAIVTDDGKIYAIGENVAREVRSVSVNIYRSFLISQGHLRVFSKPIPFGES